MADLEHVKGLAQLQTFLDQLPAKLEANVMRGALRAGMKPVKARAASNVHSVSGKLAKGLKIGTRREGTLVIAYVRAAGEHGYKAKWVEYGTAEHWIYVREDARPVRNTSRGSRPYSLPTLNRMARRGSLKIGQHFVGASVVHPGARKKPFLRPALDTEARNAVVAAGEYMKKRLETKYGLDTSTVEIGDE